LVFTGVHLQQYGGIDDATSCEVEMVGVTSTSCTIQDDNTIVATFAGGVPITDSEVLPSVWLLDECGFGMLDMCTNAEGTNLNKVAVPPETTLVTGIANALSPTEGSSNALQCSFGGGCHRTIN
jgi:hypothetical protein